jgi:hypothetical protein
MGMIEISQAVFQGLGAETRDDNDPKHGQAKQYLHYQNEIGCCHLKLPADCAFDIRIY